jgi:hypothetical protein
MFNAPPRKGLCHLLPANAGPSWSIFSKANSLIVLCSAKTHNTVRCHLIKPSGLTMTRASRQSKNRASAIIASRVA